MKHSTERECDNCGYRCFSSRKDLVCPGSPGVPDCKGTLCHVITPLPGKRVSGMLIRDKKNATPTTEIIFLPGMSPPNNLSLGDKGIWGGDTTACTGLPSYWSVEEWKEQYGKLPRKGSKSMVIIELASDGK